MDFEDDLIDRVRDYPILYRSKDKSLKNIMMKDNCWRDIAEKLNRTPQECKNKWRNIRDSYKKNQNKKKTGSGGSISKYDDERLRFIGETFDERDTISKIHSSLPILSSAVTNLSNFELTSPTLLPHDSSSSLDICDEDNKVNINILPPTKRQKRDALLEEFRKNSEERNRIIENLSLTTNRNTPVHVFFNSMADIVSTFPAEKIAEIRLQICNIVTEMELHILAQERTPPR